MAMATFRIRMYARELGIIAARRDELVNIIDELLTRFSQEQDQEWLANEIISTCRSWEEVRFLCLTLNVLMKKRFGAPFRSRAVISSWLQLRCAQIVQTQTKGDLPDIQADE
jgi:hypothetical protein